MTWNHPDAKKNKTRRTEEQKWHSTYDWLNSLYVCILHMIDDSTHREDVRRKGYERERERKRARETERKKTTPHTLLTPTKCVSQLVLSVL